MIGEGKGEANKHKKPHKSCCRRRHDVGNSGDLGRKREKRKK